MTGPGVHDPDDICTRAELAARLTDLRESSGFTVRELAARLGIPPGTLGGYFAGRHLPSPSQLMTFTALLAECGVREPDEVRRWVGALGRARSSSDGRAGPRIAPYRGLEPFGIDDAGWYFGRERATELLVERVRSIGADSASPLVPVVGASGAGKSSLLRAGLLAVLADDAVAGDEVAGDAGAGGERGRAGALITPGSDPLATLSTMDTLAELPAVLVVDQAEELFTQGAGADVADAFVARLLELAARGTKVVLGMRADFYPAAMTVPGLVPALQHNQVLVPAMSTDELRAAIVGPARRAGIEVEPAFVDAVVADLAPAGVRGRAHDPGALPLLSHALLATWSRSRRNRLTLADYRAAGGIGGAVQQSAEEVYAELDADDRERTRRLFVRLVNVSDDAVLTRRRLGRAELFHLGLSSELDDLVDTFVARRLLTADVDAVQISHEALLTAWPRLHDWLDADRAGLRVQRHLTESANTWNQAGRDDSLLLAGNRLAVVSDWVATGDDAVDLTTVEREHLRRSQSVAEARRTAERRQNRRLRRLIGAIGVLAVVAVTLAVLALHARSTAERRTAEATTARDQALSRQVAGEAVDLAARDPALAARLAAAAHAISPTYEANSALVDATGDSLPMRLLDSSSPLQAVATVGSSRVFAVAGQDGEVRLWRSGGTVPSAVATVRPSAAGALFALAVDPSGTLLAAGGADRQVDLWDIHDPSHPKRLPVLTGFGNTVYSLAFAPDGSELAAGSADASVHRWSLADPLHPVGLPRLGPLTGTDPFVQSVAYDASGTRLALVSATGELVVYDRASGRQLSRTTVGDGKIVYAVAFAPKGELLATGGKDDELQVWRLAADGTPALVRSTRVFDTQINAVAFSGDGTRLYVAGSDESVLGMDTATGAQVQSLPLPAPVTALAFDASGHLLTVGNDGVVRLWPMTARTLAHATDSVFSLGYSAGGTLAVGTGSGDGHVDLWRTRDGATVLTDAIASPVPGDPLGGASAISPDGRLLAAGTRGGRALLWDVHTPGTPRYLGVLPGRISGAQPVVQGMAFSPDSRTLASGGNDAAVRLWDVSTPSRPVLTGTLRAAKNYIFSVAFSHDGRFLAAASADTHGYVWPVAGARAGVLLGRLDGFTSYAYAVAFSPTADVLAVASADATARLFTVRAGAAPALLGRTLLGATDAIYGLAFSPDGTMLAGAAQDHALHEWTIGAHGGSISAAVTSDAALNAVAFTPDGRTVATAGSDDVVHVYDATVAAAHRTVCAVTGTPITRAEWARYVPGLAYRATC